MRALLSVADKTGIETLARGLRALGIEIISTGKTGDALTSAGIPKTNRLPTSRVSGDTDGRVKTLHPAVHGGILARRDDRGADWPSWPSTRLRRSISWCVISIPLSESRLIRARHSKQLVAQIDIGGVTFCGLPPRISPTSP